MRVFSRLFFTAYSTQWDRVSFVFIERRVLFEKSGRFEEKKEISVYPSPGGSFLG